jgi:hypothetical protein
MENQSNSNKILYAIIFLLLLGLAFTTFKLFNYKHSNEVLTVEKQDLQYLYDDLDSEYHKALSEIAELRVSNTELDSVLNIRENELLDKKNQISNLLKKGNLTNLELVEAQRLIENFRKERLVFQARVDSLTSITEVLTQDNINLLMEKDEIIEELVETTGMLKEQEEVNTKMKSKIDMASIFSTQNVSADAVRMKNNGSEEVIKRASQVEKLKVCFDILENKIVDAGYLDMKVAITAPDGLVVYLSSMGSGQFVDPSTGEEMRYTYKINPSYNKETKRICSYWVQNYPFSAGEYKVEIYQDGYQIGSTKMQLK